MSSTLSIPYAGAERGQNLAAGVKLLERWAILESDDDLAFPFLSQFSDGRLLLQGTRGVHCTRAEQTFHLISSDAGQTWKEVAMPTRIDSLNQWGLITFQCGSTIYTYEQRWQSRGGPMIGYRWARDAGSRVWKNQSDVERDGDPFWTPGPWSDEQQVRYECPKDYRNYNLHLPPISVGDGRLVALVHGSKTTTSNTTVQKEMEYNNVLAIESLDTGLTWRVCGRVSDFDAPPADGRIGYEGPCEPAAMQLDDGRILVIMRTGNINFDRSSERGFMHRSFSSDGGRTWSPLESLGMHGVRPELRRLSDGRIFLICGRPGNLLVPVDPETGDLGEVSDIFRGDPALHYESCCNPSCVEVAPGRLLFVYSHSKLCNGGVTGTDKNRMMAALIQV
ncbi:MAG: exo-alpha-sialidase [Phycisphaerales bacterium]|nr:exo-alpha-sialidase [Phycisphaerales bacterium]